MRRILRWGLMVFVGLGLLVALSVGDFPLDPSRRYEPQDVFDVSPLALFVPPEVPATVTKMDLVEHHFRLRLGPLDGPTKDKLIQSFNHLDASGWHATQHSATCYTSTGQHQINGRKEEWTVVLVVLGDERTVELRALRGRGLLNPC